MSVSKVVRRREEGIEEVSGGCGGKYNEQNGMKQEWKNKSSCEEETEHCAEGKSKRMKQKKKE